MDASILYRTQPDGQKAESLQPGCTNEFAFERRAAAAIVDLDSTPLRQPYSLIGYALQLAGDRASELAQLLRGLLPDVVVWAPSHEDKAAFRDEAVSVKHPNLP